MESNEKITQSMEMENQSEKIVGSPIIESKTHTLSSSDIDAISEAAEAATPEEVKKMHESMADTSEVEAEGGEDGYCEEIRNVGVDSSYADLIGDKQADMAAEAGNIFDITNPDYKPDDEAVKAKLIESSSEFDLSDAEALDFADILMRYRNKEDIPGLYNKLPSKIRVIIGNLAMQQGATPAQYNMIAKMFLDEFISNAELDEVFVDLEKSLDEALKIPSILDMYSEHTRTVMEEKLPEIIEKIKDKEPQNAETLMKIKEAFKESYNLQFLKSFYKADHRTRSDMRDHADNPFSYCEQLNRIYAGSKFKMPDAMGMCPALCKSLIKDAKDSTVTEGSRPDEMSITADDVSKFIILVCRSFKFYDANDLVQSTKMYYTVKNLIVLGRATEAKTDFAAELINNICDVIEFIRDQEAAYAARQHKNKKRSRK